MVPKFVDIFKTGRHKDAISIVYSHLQVTDKKWDFRVFDYAFSR